MKKFILFFLLGALVYMGYAQKPSWELNGNAISGKSEFLGTTNCEPLIFKTNDTERMRLLNDRSFLGIGVLDPNATLHLHLQIDRRSCDENPTNLLTRTLLQLTTPETGNGINNGFSISSLATKDILFQQHEQANFSIMGIGGGLTIAPNGNIGMGTEQPAQKLHVEGATCLNGNVGIGISNPTQKLHVVGNTYLNGNLGVGTSSPAQKLHVDGTTYLNGNVGIGISNPTQKLHVVGNTYLDGNVGIGIVTPQAKLDVDGTFKAASANITGNIYIGGNVGIGVNPTVKLDVSGKIRAHEVRVCLNQGCDYVFAENYKLMSLNDLNNFIKANKHLPDVAPAVEMEAEGINLSEMNALLLRKIEELTLYIIEQEEQMQNIQKRLSEIESKKGGE